jgi:hypothetical protein
VRIMDLGNWPPEGAGPVNNGESVPLCADQVMINNVLQIGRTRVIFSCLLEGRTLIYHLLVDDVNMGIQVARILSDNRGKTLLSIGTIEIPASE